MMKMIIQNGRTNLKTVAKAVTDAIHDAIPESKTTSAKIGTRSKLSGNIDSNLIGDIVTQVVNAVQPMIQSIVTAAVTASTSQMLSFWSDSIKSMKSDACTMKRVIKSQEKDIDKLEQYSRRENVKIYGLIEEENENTDERVIKLFNDIGVEFDVNDISVSHRIGKISRNNDDTRPRPLIVKLLRRNKKTEIMKNKKRLKDKPHYKNVYINDDLTQLRAKIIAELRKDDAIKQVWTIDGKIFCIQMNGDKETKRIIESPDDLYRLGWSKETVKDKGLGGFDL